MVERVLDSVRDSVLFSLDADWAQLMGRVDGLTDDEFLWEPSPGGWSVRAAADGTFQVDLEKPDPIPPPMTSIAWRMWHMGPDCLDAYSLRAFGTSGSGIDDRSWTADATEAVELLDRSFQNFRAGVASWTGDDLLTPLGEGWGAYSTSTQFDLALHAEREIVHHGAEIGLLRDLYARR